MKRQLPFFQIEDCYGGCQDWFVDHWMKIGGCAAVTACDSCIYLKRYKGLAKLYPFNPYAPLKLDWLRFAAGMKPFLRPRWHGINRLELYMDGFGEYLRRVGETSLTIRPLPGDTAAPLAAKALMEQIDAGLPVPCLTLKHQDPDLADYVWHWFLLTGYEETETGSLLVKAVTYGRARWLNFAQLWNTGYSEKGGLVLYQLSQKLAQPAAFSTKPPAKTAR